MKNKASKTVDYEKLGRMIESIYLSGYADRKRAYRFSFVKGIFAGLGSVIGATIVVALLVWMLGLFRDIPVINIITENVRETVQQK